MNDFLTFLHDQYIEPYLAAQPRDDGDAFRQSLWEGERTADLAGDVAALLRFAAVHAFLLGMKTGEGLAAARRPRAEGGS
ncbi:hypothetical protein CE91St41_10550 [Oscillospiraceae bacterium]|nr:hypothetical protein CE91St40_26990 [Oscillospiraceae bacterium]BDF74166.1 hypothetical protein CE91St41_10550 [Oscillospiraceae bacterium]